MLAAGGSAELGYEAAADWLVAVDVEERKRGRARTAAVAVEVRLGSTIEPEWLLDLFPERVEEVDRRAFNPTTDRVERTTGLRYGALMLDETVAPAPPDEETARLLAEAPSLARGLERLPGGDALPRAPAAAGVRAPAAPDALRSPARRGRDVAELVRAACVGPGQLRRARPICGARRSSRCRRRRAPRAARPCARTGHAGERPHRADPLRRGRRPGSNRACRTSSARARSRRRRAARVPLTVHLLAPNGRAVQVTRDLASFWTQHYPALRRELGRRYPKHAWPEDGATASPPPPPRLAAADDATRARQRRSPILTRDAAVSRPSRDALRGPARAAGGPRSATAPR